MMMNERKEDSLTRTNLKANQTCEPEGIRRKGEDSYHAAAGIDCLIFAG